MRSFQAKNALSKQKLSFVGFRLFDRSLPSHIVQVVHELTHYVSYKSVRIRVCSCFCPNAFYSYLSHCHLWSCEFILSTYILFVCGLWSKWKRLTHIRFIESIVSLLRLNVKSSALLMIIANRSREKKVEFASYFIEWLRLITFS